MLIIGCYAVAFGFACGALWIFLYGLYLWSQQNAKDHSELTYD